MTRHSFQPRNSLFPCFSLYFPILRALLREISPFIFPTLLFSHSVKAFRFALPSFFTPCSTFISRSTPLPSLIPPYLHPSPTFSHIPPHFSISLPNKRTIARTLAHYARTPAHIHTSGGFRLLPSPLHLPSAIRCTSTH